MSYIFINYRSEDTESLARRLNRALADRLGQSQVFIGPNGNNGGQAFVRVIENKLQQNDIFVVLIGPTWLTAMDKHRQLLLYNENDLVRLEIRAALSRHIKIVPVLVGGASQPTADELPDDIRGLALYNTVKLRATNSEAALGDLVDLLELTLTDAVAPKSKPLPFWQTAVLSILALGIVVLAFIAVSNGGAKSGQGANLDSAATPIATAIVAKSAATPTAESAKTGDLEIAAVPLSASSTVVIIPTNTAFPTPSPSGEVVTVSPTTASQVSPTLDASVIFSLPTVTPLADSAPQTGGSAPQFPGHIVFTEKVKGRWQVHSIGPSVLLNTEVVKASPDFDYFSVALSPDGSKIAYSGKPVAETCIDDDTKHTCNKEIYVANADMSCPVRITNDAPDSAMSDEKPVWSPDGQTILFVSNRYSPGAVYFRPYTVAASGGAIHEVAVQSQKDIASVYYNSWTSKGIISGALNNVWNIWRYNPDGSDAQLLFDDAARASLPDESIFPAATRDGRFVLVQGYNHDNKPQSLSLASFDAGGLAGPVKLLVGLPRDGFRISSPTWLYGEKLVAFTTLNPGGSDEIWLIDPFADNPLGTANRITYDGAEKGSLSAGPDLGPVIAAPSCNVSN